MMAVTPEEPWEAVASPQARAGNALESGGGSGLDTCEMLFGEGNSRLDGTQKVEEGESRGRFPGFWLKQLGTWRYHLLSFLWWVGGWGALKINSSV